MAEDGAASETQDSGLKAPEAKDVPADLSDRARRRKKKISIDFVKFAMTATHTTEG